MKIKAVVFKPTNAKQETLARLEDALNFRNIILNPDISRVAGIPAHYWKLKDGEIVGMDSIERSMRDEAIHRLGPNAELEDEQEYRKRCEELQKKATEEKAASEARIDKGFKDVFESIAATNERQQQDIEALAQLFKIKADSTYCHFKDVRQMIAKRSKQGLVALMLLSSGLIIIGLHIRGIL